MPLTTLFFGAIAVILALAFAANCHTHWNAPKARSTPRPMAAPEVKEFTALLNQLQPCATGLTLSFFARKSALLRSMIARFPREGEKKFMVKNPIIVTRLL